MDRRSRRMVAEVRRAPLNCPFRSRMAEGEGRQRSRVTRPPQAAFINSKRGSETVHLWPCDDEGDTWGLLESENPAVLTWAQDTIADYLDEVQSLETVLSA